MAGLTSFNPGSYSTLSDWCNKAVPIQCGVFLPFETTVGAGNSITGYPGCSNSTFAGPEKVYRLDKTTPGDLQIGLEIMTPGLNLDLFLLSSNCDQVTCLSSSTSNNATTNNEGILLPNAPIGVYYIVVDGQFAGTQGQYRLEVSCGYLNCSNAIPVNCGVPFNHTNLNGNDDVSLYGCDGGIYNVENNGPEVVHTFTITQPGWVNISLTNLQANLELFLLRSCDRGGCVDFSETGGNANEHIAAFLQPGTYYVVVDGNNGAVSTYTLLVECMSNCTLNFSSTNALPAACGQSNGVINLSLAGGSPAYFIQYTGPLSGSLTAVNTSTTISGLPAGLYQVRVTDALGCSIATTITVASNSNFAVGLNHTASICGAGGTAQFTFTNGMQPFSVQLLGPTSGTFNAGNANPYTIGSLAHGNYTAYIRDAQGCVVVRTFAIAYSSGNFNFTAAPVAAACNGSGSIGIQTSNGVPPFTIIYSGPVSGVVFNSNTQFSLSNLPAGSYSVTLKSADDCLYTRTVTVPQGGLQMSAVAYHGACNMLGNIALQLNGGTPPYVISWGGPASGSATTSSSSYLIPGLSSGNYSVQVLDAAGCLAYEILQINNSSDALSATFSALGSCAATGSIGVQVHNGRPAYSISWSGPVSGSASTSNYYFTIPQLPTGNYMVQVTDAGGCSRSGMVSVHAGGSFQVAATVNNAGCGQSGSIGLSMSGSPGPYHIIWAGPVSGSASTANATYTITNVPAGAYAVLVTAANGCQSSQSVTVANSGGGLIFTLMPIDPSCQTCAAIWIDIYNGQGPYTVVWSGPTPGSVVTSQTNFDVYCVNPGTYTVTITDASGCSGTGTVVIENSATNLQVTATPTHIVCGSNNLGSVLFHIANGQAPYRVQWVGPVSGSWMTSLQVFSIYNLPPGSYNFTITDAENCVITIPVHIQFALGLVVTPSPGPCGLPGSLAVQYTGGLPPYTVSWTGPASGSATTANTSFSINNLPAGVYSVSVSSADGCSQTVQSNLVATTGVVCTAVAQPGLCGANGSIHVGITSGQPGFTVQWSGPVSGSATTQNFFYNISNLPSGTYVVTVRDANGCQCSHTVTLSNQPNNLQLTAVPMPGVCGQPGQIHLGMTGSSGPYAIVWAGPVNGSASTSNAFFNILNLPSGTYTITVTDAQGCSRAQTVHLNNNINNLHITAVAVPGICGQPGQIHVGMSGGTPPFVVSWTGPVSGSASTTNAFYNILNLPSGTYTITVTDAQGCSRSQTVSLNNTPNTVNLVITPVPGVCGLNGSLWVDIIGGSAPWHLSWNGPATGSITLQVNGYNIPNLPSGTYTVTVVDAQGCTRTVTATLNNGANTLHITAVAIPGVCGQTGQIHVGMTGGTAPFTVVWAGPVNGSASTGNAFYNIVNLPSGSYTITVTDAQGCARTQVVVLNNTPNTLQITAVPAPGVCGQPGQIHIGITGGTSPFTVAWTGPVSGSASTGNAFYNIVNLPSGTYAITVTDAQGCSRSQTVTLNNSLNTLQLNASAVPGICGQPGQIHLGIGGGTGPYAIVWSGPMNGSANTGSTSYSIPNLPSGTYTVTVTDAQGCIRSQNVTLNNGPAITLTATGVNGICGQNGSIQLTMGGTAPPYTLSWTGPVSGSATASGSNFTITNLPAGTYTITAGSGPNCTATRTVTLNNGTAFQMTASAVPGICVPNGSIMLTLTGGAPPVAIIWNGPVSGSASTSSGTYTIPNLPSGTYVITGTTAQNCTDTETITLNNATNMLNVTGTPVNGLCGDPGSVTLAITGGTPPYTIVWTGAASGSATTSNSTFTVPNLGEGAYTFTVTDANNCVQSTTAAVDVAETDIEVSATAIPGICGQEGSVQVVVAGGNPGFIISWSGPESGSANTSNSTFVINNLTAGTYQISVTDATGCDEAATTILSAPEADVSIVLSATNGICTGPGSVTVNIISGTAPYQITWLGPVNGSTTISGSSFTISNAPAGTYFITVADANDCADTGNISVSTQPGVTATAIPVNGVCAQPGSIIVNLVGGTGPYTIAWSGAANGTTTIANTTYTIPNLGSGSYNILVTDANGCTSTATALLNNGGAAFNVNAFPYHGFCGALGYIRVNMLGGIGPFLITWTGPQSGSATTSATSFDILNLPSGLYIVTVTDSQGCTATDVEMINNSTTGVFQAHVSAINGTCGDFGSIWITILQGQGPFVITWTGPQSGTITTSSTDFDIPDLPGGTYTVTIRDFNLCVGTYTITVINAPDNLNVSLTPNNNTCGEPGSITVNIAGNAPPYLITWTSIYGSGTQTINGNTYTIPNLFTGNYTVRVEDAVGCFELHSQQVYNETGVFVMNIVPNVGGCNYQGSLQINISGGVAPFTVTWSGPMNGTATFNTQSYNIFGLNPGAYNIMVTDAVGCTQWRLVTLNPGTSLPVSAFSVSTNMLTASFTNNSSPGNYLWSFGDGTSSTAVNPVHTYAQDGNYNVCLIVNNACGSTTYCANVTITIPSNMVILDVGENSGSAGNSILVPVRIRNCSLLVSLAGTVAVQSPGVAAVIGVLPGAITPQFNTSNKTFNFYANNGQGVPLQQNQILFYFVVQLTGTAGQSTAIHLVNSPLAVEVGSMVNGTAVVLPHIAFAGSASIITAVQAGGEIFTYWGAPVPDVEVYIGNDHMDFMEMTDDAGRYEAPDLPMGEMVSVTPFKNSAPTNGLSTYGLFIGQRFILGMEPPQITTPYQVIAGDANCNGAFTTLDLFIIQQLIIGMRDSFAHCPSWVFVADNYDMPEHDFDAYNVFPYPNYDTLMVDGNSLANFTGVKVGDILGHANPDNLYGGVNIEPRNMDELELMAPNTALQEGQIVSIPVRSSNFDDITNYQLGLWFDTQYLLFEGFETPSGLPFASVAAGTSQASSGRLSISWFNMAGTGVDAGADDVLFTLRFRAVAPVGDLSGLIEVRSQWIQSEAYNAEEERLGVVLRFEQEGVTSAPGTPAEGYFLYQNAPNPFSARTAIVFDLPEAADAELIVTDPLGRTVRLIRGQYPAGRNTVWFEAGNFSPGVYRYTLKTAGFSASRSMILAR